MVAGVGWGGGAAAMQQFEVQSKVSVATAMWASPVVPPCDSVFKMSVQQNRLGTSFTHRRSSLPGV